MSGRSRPGSKTVYLSQKSVLLCFVGTLFVIYAAYSWFSDKSSTLSRTRLKHNRTWKTADFVDIPKDVLDRAKSAQVADKMVSVDLDGQNLSVFVREVSGKAILSSTNKEMSVLLLHGAGSSSQIWDKIQTMNLLAAMGIRAVALDLPGWAKSKQSMLVGEFLHGKFLEKFIKQMNLVLPVVVAPSMSGRYAIPFMMDPSPLSCHERIGAFIPLAPVHTDAYTHAEYHRCQVPTMIVYGTKDKTLGLTSLGNLRNMPNSEIFGMEGAGHANYEERPDEWHKLLYNFLLALQKY